MEIENANSNEENPDPKEHWPPHATKHLGIHAASDICHKYHNICYYLISLHCRWHWNDRGGYCQPPDAGENVWITGPGDDARDLCHTVGLRMWDPVNPLIVIILNGGQDGGEQLTAETEKGSALNAHWPPDTRKYIGRWRTYDVTKVLPHSSTIYRLILLDHEWDGTVGTCRLGDAGEYVWTTGSGDDAKRLCNTRELRMWDPLPRDLVDELNALL